MNKQANRTAWPQPALDEKNQKFVMGYCNTKIHQARTNQVAPSATQLSAVISQGVGHLLLPMHCLRAPAFKEHLPY